MQVIDFMLQNPRVPSGRFNHFFLSLFVQAFHAHAARARAPRPKNPPGSSSLRKIPTFSPSNFGERRIDDDVKRHGAPLAFAEILGRGVLMIFLAVLDDRELQRQSHLRRGKSHAGRLPHARAHGLDQILNFLAGDFRRGSEDARVAAKPGFPPARFQVSRSSRFSARGRALGMSVVRQNRTMAKSFRPGAHFVIILVSCGRVPGRRTDGRRPRVRVARYMRKLPFRKFPSGPYPGSPRRSRRHSSVPRASLRKARASPSSGVRATARMVLSERPAKRSTRACSGPKPQLIHARQLQDGLFR